MKVAIIDDEKPARSELRYLLEQVIEDITITEACSGEDALELFSKESFELICLDINLGDINGITVALAAKKMIPDTYIVFATAYNDNAEKSYEIDALYYLLKPFSKEKIEQMYAKYKTKQLSDKAYKHNNGIAKLPICIDKKFVMIDVDKIIYIEAQNRMCNIYTKDGYFQESSTLNYFEEKLMNHGFLRIHKSFLINLNYVLEVYPWFNNTYCVKLEKFKDTIIPVSRNKIKELKTHLSIL